MNQELVNLLDNIGVLSLSRNLHRARPIILMYHRILNSEYIPGVSPAVFESQLKYLRERFNVLSVNQLVSDITCNKIQPLSVALTFDDGHRDFYDNAWPLLKKYELPASLYVTTGFIDKNCWLWPDYLRHVLMSTKEQDINIPEIGTLPINRVKLLATWNTIGDYCLALQSEDRWPFLRQLAKWLDVREEGEPKPPFSPLTWSQLREMHQEGLDVGSHTVSHPILSSLGQSDLNIELKHSYRRIEQELGSPPTGICYPNGLSQDTSPAVEECANQFYRYGLVGYPAPVSGKSIMHLGRWAGTSTLSKFKQVMNGFTWKNNHRGEYR